ncbi:MAG: heavy-metal-associated domain-containing protein [Alcaligenaceae bacterium]|jgi:Cu+-exporting ATPase|nr:heavy-metal-associated domain-containing protein [Alcaligenaceae bacterium]
MQEQTIRVDGMSCQNCVKHVNEALSTVPGVEQVEVSLENANAIIKSKDGIDIEVLRTALDEAGYDLVD